MRPHNSVIGALAAWLVLPLCARVAPAMVNPSLQPRDVFDRHNNVVVLRVTDIDEDGHKLTLDVVDCPKGKLDAKQVTLRAEGEEALKAFESCVATKQCMVAFFGKASGRGGDDVTFYAADGHWGIAKQESPNSWLWTEDLDPLGDKSMFGTFNGEGDRLAEMMRDAAAGTVFFPAQPFEQFDDDVVIAKLPTVATGIALRDLDGDGRLDVVVACTAGCRVLMQTRPMTFEDKTEALGLAQVQGGSVSVADVNGDGKADLLLGGALYVATGTGGYARSDLLSGEASKDVIAASFVDINHDGWPDVLVSHRDGGLAVYLQPGKPGEPYRDATKSLGLADALSAKKADKGSGFVCAGDFTGVGRTDLFYSVGPGLLLLQGTGGTFEPGASRLRFDFSISEGKDGITGGGCMGPLWRNDTTDLVFACDAEVNFVIWQAGKPTDASGWANEITESELGLVATLAEDLNADGYVDVYALNRGSFANMFYTNRGYGSFMTPHKYKKGIFPGDAHNKGSRAGAAGDVDGDGANDLVLAANDGRICIMRNAALRSRGKEPNPTRQQQVLDRTSILTVHVRGPLGVVGAQVALASAPGAHTGTPPDAPARTEPARRILGAGDMSGCCGPDSLNIAVREPGKYSLAVTYSDGLRKTQDVDLSMPAQHISVTVSREESK